ncbi:hypothetical protein [Candidatus Nitrospira inopinata]|uniref:Uncharacterized protein n=1 Tax=Candidatus Nitrospira inopinata TaxID=1715989 RepID=A0A0S4KRW0_9BACT|nr:hypothetical protein [Candidatus Nitrospira inopinata]CUQ67079.1 exported protein of unknown function [Candidatus Nitrospira inopinata]
MRPMRRRHTKPKERRRTISLQTKRLFWPPVMTCVWLALCPPCKEIASAATPVLEKNRPASAQSAGRAGPSVGSAMAVLATLEQAGVLPPEGTKEADRVIRSTIQIQSLFMKSDDPAVRNFLQRAVANKAEDRTEQRLAEFGATGWTAEVLEALADAATVASSDELRLLSPGLASFNLSTEDFQRFMQLIKDGERALASRGRTFGEIFADQRKMMPGATAR